MVCFHQHHKTGEGAKMYTPEKLKQLREAKGLSQTDFVFELDKHGLRITRQTLINWESGNTTPDANDIAVLSAFFNKPVQYFFEPEPKHSNKGINAH